MTTKTQHTEPRPFRNSVQPTLALLIMLVMTMMTTGKVWGQTRTEIGSLSEIIDMNGNYVIKGDISDASGHTTIAGPFTGTLTADAKEDGTFPVISGLKQPIFATVTGATISNIMLKSVTIEQAGYVGAIACTANGATRIYNCGILPTTLEHTAANRSTVASTNNHCGSLVGYLDGYARVINCFSYANVAAGTGESINAGGLVGYNTTATMQGNNQTNFNNNCKTMIVNCMFYGDITQGTVKRPVYGGTAIVNNAEHKVNLYDYYCEEEASFDDGYTAIGNYNYSWPVAKKYLVRFEVYRNILNSNRRLCTWWVNGTYNTCPTEANVESVGIAKWVLDQTIAPYPILKKWGKYYSTFDIDPDYVWNPKTKTQKARGKANAWEGKSYNTLSVTINGGSNNSSASVSRNITITDMDTLGYDYCARKIQLPYYNEIFGNPNGTTWAAKYGNNYTSKVVTGWKVTAVNNNDQGGGYTFDDDWESGCNYANRSDKYKDLYAKSGRVFAQGGYYYVPDGVTGITIEAYWGNAVYLCNTNNRLDRVNNGGNDFYNSGALSFGQTPTYPYWPGGTGGNVVKTSLSNAVGELSVMPSGSVYDQAIVLVGNYQNNAFHSSIKLKGSEYDSKAKPFSIMSADFDFDNEPDFCFQAGMSSGRRENVHPIRFDFLMVPDITMAIRIDNKYYGMRIFCPQGHFEITETSYMYTTQFEYDERNADDYKKHEAPMILNGGEFMQIVSSEAFAEAGTNATATSRVDATSYFLMGGRLYMKAFTPGCHGNKKIGTRHCAVNAIGGEYPEFYLSGMFRSDFFNMTDNPHCYIDGGKFGLIAGAGMESVGASGETSGGDVTFKINHSWINEFYGGGINANRPVTGIISTTCDNSMVQKYCGGPKLGDMSNTKSITNSVTGSTFGEYYGGGNGGTNKERVRIKDSGGGVAAPTPTNASTSWNGDYGFQNFSVFRYVDGGYETDFEFEMLPFTNGSNQVVKRTYHYIATFARTMVAPISNTVKDCVFKGNFYGGGNLGAVDGVVISTLDGVTEVRGNAFGGGFSASASSFPVHDRETVVFPYQDASGFLHDGYLEYEKYDSDITDPTTGEITHHEGDSICYTWIHDVPSAWNISPTPSMNQHPTFEYPSGSGNWYVYTTQSLDNLGAISGKVTLTIKGNTTVGTLIGGETGTLKPGTGNVYGGGDQSAVNNDTEVILQGSAHVLGNVYGGGNNGPVEGDSKVNIQDTP